MPNFPTSLDAFTIVNGTTLLSTGHADLHNQVGSAVIALENKLGLGAGTPILDKILVGSGNGTSTWGSVLNNATFGTPLITGGTINNPIIGTPLVTGGTVNSSFLGTPTIIGGSIALSGTVVALTIGGALAPSLGSVADAPAGTITVNAQQSNVFYSVMGTTAGNRTIGTPKNPTSLQVLTFGFQTSGSANGTLVWDTGAFTISQEYGTPTLGTSTAWHWFSWRYNPVSTKWQFQGASKNII